MTTDPGESARRLVDFDLGEDHGQVLPVTYYATVDERYPRDRPLGIYRRIHTAPPTDQVFARDLAWHPTEYLVRYWLGHNDIDHVEITRAEAQAVIARWLGQDWRG